MNVTDMTNESNFPNITNEELHVTTNAYPMIANQAGVNQTAIDLQENTASLIQIPQQTDIEDPSQTAAQFNNNTLNQTDSLE